MANDSQIQIDREVRDAVKAVKRGDETYNSVLRKMLAQYDPDEAADTDQ